MKELARRVIRGFDEHDLLTFAGAISFKIVVAVIPLSMFALALLGFLHLDPAWHNHLAPQLRSHVSREVYALADRIVRTALSSKRLFWATAGFLIAVWEVSGAMRALMDALSRVYGDVDHRPRARRFGLSFALAIGVAVGVVLSFAVVRLGPTLWHGLPAAALRWPVAFVLLTGVVWLVMRYAPCEPCTGHTLGIGSAGCVFFWLAGSGLFGLYVSDVADYGSIFASLGAVFVALSYVYLSVCALLAGAQVDALLRGRDVGLSFRAARDQLHRAARRRPQRQRA